MSKKTISLNDMPIKLTHIKVTPVLITRGNNGKPLLSIEGWILPTSAMIADSDRKCLITRMQDLNKVLHYFYNSFRLYAVYYSCTVTDDKSVYMDLPVSFPCYPFAIEVVGLGISLTDRFNSIRATHAQRIFFPSYELLELCSRSLRQDSALIRNISLDTILEQKQISISDWHRLADFIRLAHLSYELSDAKTWLRSLVENNFNLPRIC